MEYVSPEGLRLDGRSPMEMRKLRAEIGTVAKADVLLFLRWAITPKSLQRYVALERRSAEISLVIRQTMEACILTHLMPRSQIDIFVQVLQADGGTRSACINAATLAWQMLGSQCVILSLPAGLDLNYVEDSAGGPDITVGILPKLDKVIRLQMDAKLTVDIFENVMGHAIEGCKAVTNYIEKYYKRTPSNWSIARVCNL